MAGGKVTREATHCKARHECIAYCSRRGGGVEGDKIGQEGQGTVGKEG